MADPVAVSITAPDVQAQLPTLHVGLSRVGVTGVEKVIRIRNNGDEQLYHARLECVVDLGPRQKGAHMSRFEEVVNDAIGEVVLGEAVFRAESLAQRVAELVRDRQDARRAEVRIAARFPEHKPAPVSGIPTQEIYELFGTAVASARGTRRITGVAAQGMTACPCAQELVAGRARERLARRAATRTRRSTGSSSDVPVATHNQRGLGTLHVGCTELCEDDIDAARAARHRRELDVVGDLRADEALRRGRRRREGPPPPALRRGLRARDDRRRRRALRHLADEVFVSARQENLETIHQHNVVAERFGLLGELRAELATGEHAERDTTMSEWLEGGAARLGLGPGARDRAPLRARVVDLAPDPERVVDAGRDGHRDRHVDEQVDPQRRVRAGRDEREDRGDLGHRLGLAERARPGRSRPAAPPPSASR